MSRYALIGLLAVAGPLFAQEPPPTPAEPAQLSADQKREQDAKKLFARAALENRQDRHLDAIRSLEECIRLDPDAAPPRKLLAAQYGIVGRMADAAECARFVVTKRPDDFDGWRRYAAILKETGKAKDAVEALAKAVACPSAGADPELLFNTLQRLCIWAEKVQDFAAVEAASRQTLALLEKSRAAFRASGLVSDGDFLIEKGDAWERVGRACLKQQRFDAALEAYREAAALFAGRQDDVGLARTHRLHLHLAELHQARGEPDQALPHLSEYLKLKPQSMEPYRLLISLHQRLRTPDQGVARLEEYARKDKANTALQLYLAEQYGETNRIAEADQVYDALLHDQPKVEYYRGLVRLGLRHDQMRQLLNRLDEQLKIADDGAKTEETRELANRHARALYAALKDNPAALRAILPLALREMLHQIQVKQNFSYKTFEKLAGLAVQAGELEAAERLFREAQGIVRFPELLASVDEPLINVLMAEHKYDEVVDLCRRRLPRTQHNQFMYAYYMAFPEAVVSGLEPGLQSAEQAVQLAHNDDVRLMARIQKVNILLWHDRKTQAIEEAEKLQQEYRLPKHLRRVRLTLARVYGANRDYAKAEHQLRTLLETDPNDAQANNDLGYQLADQGRNLDEAESLVRRALDVDRLERQRGGDEEEEDDPAVGENAAYLDSLGWVLFRRGHLAEARDTLEKATALPGGKDDPTVWDHLGDVLFRLGDSTKAKEAWGTAVRLCAEQRRNKKDSRFEELRRKLTLIQ